MAYDNNAVPGQQSPTEAANPILGAVADAFKAQQAAVDNAAKQLNSTSQTLNTHAPAPNTDPKPKVNILGGASSTNLNNNHPETVSGAKGKAIGQIAGQAGSLISAWTKKKEAEKTQALSIDLHRSLELQNGMDEAKAVLANDPNNAEAKAALQKNSTLMSALLNGKNGKEIAKAYGVTFGPEAQKMSPEDKKDSMHHKAMQNAMKQYQQDQQAKPMGGAPQLPPPKLPQVTPNTNLQEFESKLPERITQNPMYQAAKANYDAAVKRSDELGKTQMELAGKVITAQTSADNNVRTNNTRDKDTDKLIAGREKEEKDKEVAARQLEVQKHQERMGEIAARGSEARKTVKEAKAPQDKEKAAMLYFGQASADERKYTDQLEKLASDKSKLTAKDGADAKAIDAQILETQDLLKAAKDQKNEATGLMLGDHDAATMMEIFGGIDNK